jgi:tetratricopeptide (TPR) repeat protein
MLADNYSTWSFGALWLGEFEQAVVEAEEAYRITKSIDNTWGQATSRLWIGLAYLEQGRFEAALEVQRDGLRLALEAEVPPAVMFMGAFLGMSYGVIGSLPDGFAALKEALQVDPTQFLSFACMPRSVLARLHLWNGDIPQARLAMQSSYEGFKPVGSMHAADQVLITDAEIELAAGDSSKAIERIDQMLSLARAAGRRLYLPEALLLRGRALLAQSALTQAGENLQEAHQWADQLGSRRVLWQILLEQSRLAAKSGDPDRAEQLRAAAGQAVIQLTASISNPDLRRSFAALPDAREALAGQVGAGPTAG